jgi:hypothetical protein
MSKIVVGRADAADYFTVNDKPMGVSTSFRVSGRRGELGKRFALFADAKNDCKRLNKAYERGVKDASAAYPDLIEAAEDACLALEWAEPEPKPKLQRLRSALLKAKGGEG